MLSKVLLVFGTRPEAIKLCPLVHELRRRSTEFQVRICITAQHRSLLDSVLKAFDVTPDVDLDIMRPDQSLSGLTARILEGMDAVYLRERPAIAVVQGDTTTTMAASLAAFYRRVPVGHVEAGLRTGDSGHPFPEEMNRVLTGRLADLHFAPTRRAAGNLEREGVAADRIVVTGNTGVDALLQVRERLEAGQLAGYDGPLPGNGCRLIVVTAHRRESFGAGFERICDALRTIAITGEAEIVYPVHPNPNVRAVVRSRLGDVPGIHLIEPLDYVPFVDLLRRAALILTDSGGIQEEAPSLGVPVLVMRETTERQEAVDAGTAQLVGTNVDKIVNSVAHLLESTKKADSGKAGHNPFGDGRACSRICDAIHSYIKRS